MSTLRSGLEEFQVQDLRYAGEADLEEDLLEIERAAGVLEVERARRVAEIRERGSYRRDGHLSAGAFLAHLLRISRSVSERYLRWARAMEKMPLTKEALSAGEISSSAAASLIGAGEAHPEAFTGSEELLVDAARSLDARDLARALAYWRQAADASAAEEQAERCFEARRLHVSRTLGGMVRVDADLGPETGQVLISALRAVTDAEVRVAHDLRSSSQQRADALGQICRSYLDRTDRPEVAGERPHLTLTVDLQALQGTPGRRCELEDAGPISPETARRIACDASLSRVITTGASQVLDVGRKTPVVPAALRRAVVVRDEHCRFPGCDRPQGWCDAHHVRHWADGGETSLQNLVLLCRAHHRLVHRIFKVELVDGRATFFRPDGTPLEDRGPP